MKAGWTSYCEFFEFLGTSEKLIAHNEFFGTVPGDSYVSFTRCGSDPESLLRFLYP